LRKKIVTHTFYVGNVLDVLRTLPSESVHCVVTSPPYYQLRDYGLPPTVWGGDPDCEHEWSEEVTERKRGSICGVNAKVGNTLKGVCGTELRQGRFCCKCGAWLGCLGLEPTPELYVEHLVEVFREVRRVLRKDGTLWLNLGDSYAGSNCGSNDHRPDKSSILANSSKYKGQKPGLPKGLKPKDLIGIPWMVAFALRNDGWYLRSDIIWSKPNCLPESVRDRPTKVHEYVFLLAKCEKYFYDADAIREQFTNKEVGWFKTGAGKTCYGVDGVAIPGDIKKPTSTLGGRPNPVGRNKRSVWTIATEPFSEAHFAPFPQALVEPCVKAGTSEKGCCPKCSAPWERVLEVIGMTEHGGPRKRADAPGAEVSPASVFRTGKIAVKGTTHWHPTCSCGVEEATPCVVLDPFGGSGTTSLVAAKLGRSSIYIDLSPFNASIRKDVNHP